MGRCIAYHDGLFLEWSSVVDAPVTFGMTEPELREHIKERYGSEGLRVADSRIERAKRVGTSYLGSEETFDDLVSYNRAGPNETCLSKEQLVRIYMVERRYGRKDTHLPDEQELISQLEVTEEMIEAGIEAAWEEPNAPPSVRFIVERVYRAMEAKRRSGDIILGKPTPQQTSGMR